MSKLYDRNPIIAALAIFVIVITCPIWTNLAGPSKPQPKKATGQCVADPDYMRKSHPDLLHEWRDLVVREGKRKWNGKHDMSLTKTCLGCHSSKAEFCDECHNYLGVKPRCWKCHVDPKEKN